MRTKIKDIYKNPSLVDREVTVKGWVRTVREQKTFAFVEINDGSTLANLQVIVDKLPEGLTTGSSLSVSGLLKNSPGSNQSVEVHATKLEIIGACDQEKYPLQKKRHSFEFLRTIAHLRPRTNTIGAVTRVRNALAYATHKFFQGLGFLYLHTPIITPSDCEGAGKLFQVSTAEDKDFFGKKTYLTVSGQLNAEMYACALSDVYTFGPTFRAENSNTFRHLAEFWMIEPEMAFADIHDDMDLAENYLKSVFGDILINCKEDMNFFDKFICKGILERLESLVKEPFIRITYTDAVHILQKSNQQFNFPVHWGCDLQSEHERYLCEKHFGKPVILRDFPAEIKSFYMRANEDGKTVAAMDVLVPGVGEIIGGSQREERLDILEQKVKLHNLNPEDYEPYLDLRRYGSVPHAGFGVGFERLVQFVTGMENIRDVSAFPRYPGHADF